MKAMRLHKIGDFKYEDVELRDIKDDEIPKLDQLDVDMQEQFKSITGVKVSS